MSNHDKKEKFWIGKKERRNYGQKREIMDRKERKEELWIEKRNYGQERRILNKKEKSLKGKKELQIGNKKCGKESNQYGYEGRTSGQERRNYGQKRGVMDRKDKLLQEMRNYD